MTSQNDTKKCFKCNEIKSIDDFSKYTKALDGHQNNCKLCNKQYRLLHRTENIDYLRQYRVLNKTVIKEKRKDKYDNNEIHRLHIKNYVKKYNKENRTIKQTRDNSYVKTRLKTDSNYKLLHNLRRRRNKALKNNSKYTSTIESFCCTIEEVWNHLEKQFRDGMTRENYGKVWHVDHIIPLQFFADNDLIDQTNQKIANHWGNLQPLLVRENLSKGDKVPEKTNFIY
jgi:hypothetical protein